MAEVDFVITWVDGNDPEWQKRKAGALAPGEIREIPVIHMEKTNWKKKGSAFLRAKFRGKKYSGSF
ncbi:MAG: Stealth CR1 domain-containing protein [Clostridia bacterium]|nr:Stealth CR1 domain-containing protein [Clostridia bacterium]